VTVEENVAEMICFAFNERYDKMEIPQKNNVKRWAESIITYVKAK
jgi:hypothetical protein